MSTDNTLPEAVREQIEGEIDAVLNACNTKSFERVKSEVLDVLTSMVEASAQQERAYWRDRAKLLAEGFHQANRNTGNRPCANHEFADCPAEVCANNLVWLASHPPPTPEDR